MNNSAIDEIMQRSKAAFAAYKNFSLKQRSAFMHMIGEKLEKRRKELVSISGKETHLSEKRLNAELSRTIFQLQSYGSFCESGEWMDIRIDKGDPNRVPPKPDLRKMMVPLGPVIVFGAANFPFAYSTAGGDTASAFAAGCSVVVKAHPGHLQTGILIAEAVDAAIAACEMPKDIFIHVTDTSTEAGEALVMHPNTAAVGFTGSYKGGKYLFDKANQRSVPIPVFAEMSSVNPVFILPRRLQSSPDQVAEMLAASVTLDAGQFCTNPGVIVVIDDEATENFIQLFKKALGKVQPVQMLNEGISKNFNSAKQKAVSQSGVEIIVEGDHSADKESVTIALSSAKNFIANDILQQEVFGPYSIIVKCRDVNEMNEVAKHMHGQLTSTIIAEEEEVKENKTLVESISSICGRLIMNGVPTGVEVCLAMHHGGPFPASTDSRFTSVGGDAIKRFARPMSFQNWPEGLLPEELRDGNR